MAESLPLLDTHLEFGASVLSIPSMHRRLVRYLTVTPAGLLLGKNERPRSDVKDHILGFGGARTCYRKRKAVRGSLDGDAWYLCQDACRRYTGKPAATSHACSQMLARLTFASSLFGSISRVRRKHTSASAARPA